MCGISGIVTFDGASVDASCLHRMIAAIRHRGPDESGAYIDGGAGLAHARLSIIDLAGGHQPMYLEDKSLCITFNGEIFNYLELRDELIRKGHVFTTVSDTEVILHLYQEEGADCVGRLNGQWAFAIWDAARQRLFLSRDRMGVRPLFYTTAGGRFLFASEIKALFACPEVSREMDLQSLNQVFTFWVTLPPRTIFKDIWQLPPGSSMIVEGGRLRVWEHWRLEFPPEDHMTKEAEEKLAEQLFDLMLDATRLRLRSDVPVGAYLSGGLDSTFTAALTKRLVGDRLRTFSVVFDDPAFDESAYQTEASAFLETQHSSVRCSYDDIARVFPDVVWHAEQPILRTAPAPLFLLSEFVRDSGFKVVITGEGADESLGGYDIYKETKIRRFWARNPASSIRPLLLKRLYPYMQGIQQQSPAYLARFFRATAGDLAGPFFSHVPRWMLTSKLKLFFSDAVKSELFLSDELAAMRDLLPRAYKSWDTFLQAQFLETAYLLPGYILSAQGDRMAMAHSIEGRFPFLDHRVVEFASRLPVRMKMKVLQEKYLLKQCADGMVPASVKMRPKQPYRAPDGVCFLEPSAREYVDELLSPDSIRKYGIFEPGPAAKLLAKFRAGDAIGVKDNMALVGIVSTQLIIHQFVNTTTRRNGSHADSRRVATVYR